MERAAALVFRFVDMWGPFFFGRLGEVRPDASGLALLVGSGGLFGRTLLRTILAPPCGVMLGLILAAFCGDVKRGNHVRHPDPRRPAQGFALLKTEMGVDRMAGQKNEVV